MRIPPRLQTLLIITLLVACSMPQGRDLARRTSPTSGSPSRQQPTATETASVEPTADPTNVRDSTSGPKPSIVVTSPNGGEVWLEGSTHTIAWRSSGVRRIDVEAASGGKPWIVALDVDASSGQLPWEVPVGLISNFGLAASDAMRVRISSSDDPHLYDQSDESFTVRCPPIQFEPGATSTVVTGTLEATRGSYRYVLHASAGQALEIKVSPAKIELDVWGAEDGSTWRISEGEERLTVTALPTTQNYFVTLTNPSPDEATSYRLQVAVR